MSRLIPRRIYDIALERQRESPVVLLEGSRVVGKSRLLRQLTDHLGGQLLDLDDLDTRAAVTRDPATMIAGDGPVLIDEYQHAPVVLDAIKAQLNISSRPGQFILTGSAHHESLPRAAQALTGRLQRLPILPLAQSELTGTRPDLVRQLIDASSHARAVPPSTTSREDYVSLVVRGGFHRACGTFRPCSLAMTEFGHLLESFVVGELLKEVSWTEEIAGYGHWRTRDDLEVDLVLETEDGASSVLRSKRPLGSREATSPESADSENSSAMPSWQELRSTPGPQLHPRRPTARHADRPTLE
ncbi:MAG: AAA family ATPase [Marmoricola sp.]